MSRILGYHLQRPDAADLYAAGGELYADGGLGLKRELVAREARQQVGLADARVTNQHHLEQVVIAAGASGSEGELREAGGVPPLPLPETLTVAAWRGQAAAL